MNGTTSTPLSDNALSIVSGVPLEEEPGIGSLTIGGYLREVVSRYGPREAIVLRAGETRLAWTYDALLSRSLEVARALVARGVGRDERVGILMTNRPEFLASLFGAALAGAVPVALSTFSTASELDVLFRTSQISVLLFEQQVLSKNFGEMLIELEPAIGSAGPDSLTSDRFPFLRALVSLGAGQPAGNSMRDWQAFLREGEAISEALVLARADAVAPSDAGGIFFSSGTTSQPKGIVHSQRAFAIQWWRWPRVFCMNEPVRSWTGNGFFWSGNVSMVVGSALSTGGAVILQRYFDEQGALHLIEQEKITFLSGRPHQWARLQAAPNWSTADLSSLKYITRGELICEHPTVATSWRVPMSFGTTETMTICTAFTADTPEDYYAGSFGAPLPGNVLKIVDPLSGELKPVGERGEMCIKGPTLMTGYLGKAPEDCFDEQGFYRSGDGGYVDAEGRFFWEGRLTDIIKTGGANVSPEEVDAVIARFPGVKRSQTVGVPDDLLGEIVVSCIVPLDGTAVSEHEITAFLKSQIASFKIPRRILFLGEDEYELTGNEKAKTSVLRDLAAKRLMACAEPGSS